MAISSPFRPQDTVNLFRGALDLRNMMKHAVAKYNVEELPQRELAALVVRYFQTADLST